MYFPTLTQGDNPHRHAHAQRYTVHTLTCMFALHTYHRWKGWGYGAAAPPYFKDAS